MRTSFKSELVHSSRGTASLTTFASSSSPTTPPRQTFLLLHQILEFQSERLVSSLPDFGHVLQFGLERHLVGRRVSVDLVQNAANAPRPNRQCRVNGLAGCCCSRLRRRRVISWCGTGHAQFTCGVAIKPRAIFQCTFASRSTPGTGQDPDRSNVFPSSPTLSWRPFETNWCAACCIKGLCTFSTSRRRPPGQKGSTVTSDDGCGAAS